MRTVAPGFPSKWQEWQPESEVAAGPERELPMEEQKPAFPRRRSA
jgi:hypothetical protein